MVAVVVWLGAGCSIDSDPSDAYGTCVVESGTVDDPKVQCISNYLEQACTAYDTQPNSSSTFHVTASCDALGYPYLCSEAAGIGFWAESEDQC